LVQSLHSVDWHREFMHRQAHFLTPLEALYRLLLLRSPIAPRVAWDPALYRNTASHGWNCAIVGSGAASAEATVLAFRPMQPGQIIELLRFKTSAVDFEPVRILGPEPLRSLSAAGLDGTIIHRYRATFERNWTAGADQVPVAAE